MMCLWTPLIIVQHSRLGGGGPSCSMQPYGALCKVCWMGGHQLCTYTFCIAAAYPASCIKSKKVKQHRQHRCQRYRQKQQQQLPTHHPLPHSSRAVARGSVQQVEGGRLCGSCLGYAGNCAAVRVWVRRFFFFLSFFLSFFLPFSFEHVDLVFMACCKSDW
jgi:hypothetical protein